MTTASNEIEVLQWEDDPWYPAIRRAHDRLTQEVPGYKIVQIKDKFGGLRFYYSLPDDLNTDEYRGRADRIVSYAEGWVDGLEYALEGDE